MEKLKNEDYSNFSEKFVAAIKYAIKLTKSPHLNFKEDLNQLEQAGWSKEAILEINLITSYFNMMNRIAAGMNVPLEESGEHYIEYAYGENGRLVEKTKK